MFSMTYIILPLVTIANGSIISSNVFNFLNVTMSITHMCSLLVSKAILLLLCCNCIFFCAPFLFAIIIIIIIIALKDAAAIMLRE